MKITVAQLLRKIDREDDCAIHALLRLYERTGTWHEPAQSGYEERDGAWGFRQEDVEFLTSLAEDAMTNRHLRERGQLRPGYGLLSTRQLEVLRRLLRRHYGPQLLAIATERHPELAAELPPRIDLEERPEPAFSPEWPSTLVFEGDQIRWKTRQELAQDRDRPPARC